MINIQAADKYNYLIFKRNSNRFACLKNLLHRRKIILFSSYNNND